MTTLRTLLKRAPARENDLSAFLWENADRREGILLRVPRERLPADVEFVTVEINVDSSGATGRCITFLREAVRRALEGRLSGNNLWAAWAEWNGGSPSEQIIAEIDRKDIHNYFRVAFNEDELSWKRLDGKSQWVWMGYELVSKGDDSVPGDDSTKGDG